MTARISVIIPAYNVEPFVQECLDSVKRQSFSDFEALIVLGKSNDRTEDVCKAFADTDSRFRIVYQQDKGLGSARNLGIAEAHAGLIAFLDADDWWDSSMLEKLYAKMQEKDYDMVICDRYNVYYDSNGEYKSKEWLHERAMEYEAESVRENKDLICDIEVSVNDKLYKKYLFVDYDIKQPNCFGEDRAVSHYLIAKCKAIGKVPEPLYYYRTERPGNSVCNALVYRSTAECMEYVYSLFEKDNLQGVFRKQLRRIFIDISNIGRIGLRYGQLEENAAYKVYESQIEKSICNHFPELERRCWLIGSYNTWRLAREAFYKLKGIDKNRFYSYSSLVSMFSKGNCAIELRENRNRDQDEWLKKDVKKKFLDDFQPGKEDILIIDFMEERYPVFEYKGTYYTGSPLFIQYTDIPLENIRVLREDKRKKLWQESCKEFIRGIKEKMDISHILLVKMRLSKRYKKDGEDFDYETVEEVEKINDRLDECYKFFIHNCPGIKMVDFAPDNLFYTDYYFPHGCHPCNLNEEFYRVNETTLVDAVFN